MTFWVCIARWISTGPTSGDLRTFSRPTWIIILVFSDTRERPVRSDSNTCPAALACQTLAANKRTEGRTSPEGGTGRVTGRDAQPTESSRSLDSGTLGGAHQEHLEPWYRDLTRVDIAIGGGVMSDLWRQEAAHEHA